MDIWQIDKIALFLVLFIPGFISTKVYDLLVPSARRDFSSSLLEVIGYSSLNFAALSWLIVLIHLGDFCTHHPAWYFVLLFSIIFIMPILWPILLLKLSSLGPVAKHLIHPIQKPWDYIFSKKEAFWVIVNLKDGRKIGGRFDISSFASSYPAEEQIYLEEVWKLDKDGNFLMAIKRSKGILILGKEILAVEFFK